MVRWTTFRYRGGELEYASTSLFWRIIATISIELVFNQCHRNKESRPDAIIVLRICRMNLCSLMWSYAERQECSRSRSPFFFGTYHNLVVIMVKNLQAKVENLSNSLNLFTVMGYYDSIITPFG